MGKKARSARGVMVDFDLMQIKRQIAAAPTPLEVKARQNFIENRLKRRIKKAQDEIDGDVKPEMPEPAVTLNEKHIEDVAKEDVVSEALAAVETETEERTIKKSKTTKQIARPKKTAETENKED